MRQEKEKKLKLPEAQGKRSAEKPIGRSHAKVQVFQSRVTE